LTPISAAIKLRRVSEPQVYAESTTVGAYTEAIARALEMEGVDPAAVLSAAHVERIRRNDPMLRITESDINAIFARAVEATGDPCFGLKVAQQIAPGVLHALGYALLASDTLEDLCRRMVRFWGLVAQGVDVWVREVDETELLFGAAPRNPGLCFETQDVWAALVLRLMRDAHHQDFNPLRMELRRPLPAGGDEAFRRFFRCPIEYNREFNWFHFDLRVMCEPLVGASPEMAQYNDQIVMGYLEKLDRDDIVNRVRSHIVNGLSAGAFSRSEIADELHMSASTLQVKLARRGQSFQQILDDTRHELALGYISQSRLSVTEIAFMLGFSDLSNFIRAFRRWTGKSPTEFRGGLQ